MKDRHAAGRFDRGHVIFRRVLISQGLAINVERCEVASAKVAPTGYRHGHQAVTDVQGEVLLFWTGERN